MFGNHANAHDINQTLNEKDILVYISEGIENYKQGKGFLWKSPNLPGLYLKIPTILDNEMQSLLPASNSILRKKAEDNSDEICKFIEKKLNIHSSQYDKVFNKADERTPIPHAREFSIVINPESIAILIVNFNDYVNKPCSYAQGAAMGAFEDSETPFSNPMLARHLGSFLNRTNAAQLVINKKADAYAIAEEEKEIDQLNTRYIRK